MERLEDSSGERVARLLREAHLFRMRAQFEEAAARCRAALDLAADDVDVLQMLGELLQDQGRLEEARACFQRVLELQPGMPTAEKRLAQVVLEISERQQERLAAQMLLAGGDTGAAERKRNALIALLLSLLCAGLGQFYNREYFKGAVLAITFVVGMWFGFGPLLGVLLVFSGIQPRNTLIDESGVGPFLFLLGLLAYIISLIDASARAQKIGGRRKGGWF
ncbi:MAG: tetratricopeptide repeat protein [Armatimonadetes bacterium]|nr:tetratricopeptide repeat protein [Armatimonadota bacterium]